MYIKNYTRPNYKMIHCIINMLQIQSNFFTVYCLTNMPLPTWIIKRKQY